MSILSKFFKGGLLLTLSSIVVRLSGIFVLIPLARLLNVEALGIYSLIFWILQACSAVGRLGVDVTMHRNGAKLYKVDPQATGRLIGVGSTLMFASMLSLSILLWIFRLQLATYWVGQPSAASWFGYASVALLSEGVGIILMTGLLSLHEFRSHSLVTSVSALARLVVIPILAWLYGISGALSGMVICSTVQMAVAFFALNKSLKQYQIQLNCQNFILESIEILKFGLPFYAGSALIGLVSVPLLGEIGRQAGVAILGQYRIAQSLGQVVGFLPTAISPVAISLLSETHGSEHENFQHLRSIHLRSNWLLVLILTTLLSLTSRLIVVTLFGEGYEPAVPIVIGVCWVSLFVVIAETFNLYSLSSGETMAIAVGSIAQKVILIGLTFSLIGQQGIFALIIGSIAATVLQSCIMLISIWHTIESTLKRYCIILMSLTPVCAVITYQLGNAILPVWKILLLAVVISLIFLWFGVRVILDPIERLKVRRFVKSRLPSWV